MRSAVGGSFASPLCLAAAALSSAVGEGVLGLLEEPATYRLYHCRRCRMQVCVCVQCDCGNLYCPGDCYVVTSADVYIPATPEQLTTAALQFGVRVHLMSGCSPPLVDALGRCCASSGAIRCHPSCVAHPGGAGATPIDPKRDFTYFT